VSSTAGARHCRAGIEQRLGTPSDEHATGVRLLGRITHIACGAQPRKGTAPHCGAVSSTVGARPRIACGAQPRRGTALPCPYSVNHEIAIRYCVLAESAIASSCTQSSGVPGEGGRLKHHASGRGSEQLKAKSKPARPDPEGRAPRSTVSRAWEIGPCGTRTFKFKGLAEPPKRHRTRQGRPSRQTADCDERLSPRQVSTCGQPNKSYSGA
jgi:hypothetical protein